MARPRKYSSDSERRAARLEAQARRRRGEAETSETEMKPKPVEAETAGEAETLRNDPEPLRNEAETPDPGQPDIEPWRLAAREYMKTGKLTHRRLEASPDFVPFRDHPEVPRSLWAGVGRGVPVAYKGKHYVLVARGRAGDELYGVVDSSDWYARLGQRCGHGMAGWACHAC